MFHPLECFVGMRYVWSRRRRGLISFMSGASLSGVALGVAALIIVLSVMNGLEAETRNRLLSLSWHASFSSPVQSDITRESIIAGLQAYEGIEHVAPYVEIEGMLSVGSRLLPAMVRGIDPAIEAAVFPEAAMIDGEFAALSRSPDGIVIGRALAINLGVVVGDTLSLLHAHVENGRPRPRLAQLRIVGIFSAQIAEHDAGLALIQIDRAAGIAGPSARRDVGVRISEPLQIEQFSRFVAESAELRELVYTDWSELHSSHFRAIRIEKTMISVMLMLIVAVAAFNIVASLMMVVNSKSTDVAILRTLGLEPARVAGIFVFQGSIVGISGTLIGTLLGVLAALNIGSIVPWIESVIGVQVMPADVYYISQIPSQLQWTDVVVVNVVAVSIALCATLYPSRKAARIAPAIALRYE